MTQPIQVLVVDDHAVVRAGITLLLGREDDIEPVGEAASGREAIFEARSLKPDVILIDVVMPDGNGLEVIPTLLRGAGRRRRSSSSRCRTTPATSVPHSRPAQAATCSRRPPTSKSSRLFAKLPVAVATSTPSSARGWIAADADAARKAEEDPLSDREREVLRLLALGHTNQEIAKQLFISVRTAETHRAHIMQKLRLSSRAELVRYALAHDLLEPSDS